MRRLLLGLAALVLAGPAAAQNYAYAALLGPQDMYNSSGVRLGDFCAIVQQDRANFHRFGRRDPYDSPDPYFGDPSNRALIPQLCRLAPGNEYVAQRVLAGEPRYIVVYVTLSGGRIVDVIVAEGAG